MSNKDQQIIEHLDRMLVAFNSVDAASLPAIRVIRAIRKELKTLGMSPSYRDQFIATMKIVVNPDHSDAVVDKFCELAVASVRRLYVVFSNEGFNDEAIALMGPDVELEI